MLRRLGLSGSSKGLRGAANDEEGGGSNSGGSGGSTPTNKRAPSSSSLQHENASMALATRRQQSLSPGGSMGGIVPPRPPLGSRSSSSSGGVPRLAYVYSVPLIHRIGPWFCFFWGGLGGFWVCFESLPHDSACVYLCTHRSIKCTPTPPLM